MAAPITPENQRQYVQMNVDSAIQIGLLAVLTLWAFNIVRPFIEVVLWGVIIAVAVAPLHVKLSKRIGGRPKTASVIMTLIALAIMLLYCDKLTALRIYHDFTKVFIALMRLL